MDEQEYKKSIELLCAPESAVDKAVRAALDAEEKRMQEQSAENKKQKSKASAIIKIISALAACAVVATGIATGSRLYNSSKNTSSEKNEISMIISPEQENYFALMVDDKTIDSGEIISFAEADFSDVVSTNEIFASIAKNEDGSYSMEMRPRMSIPIGCIGSNIRSITYNTNGCAMTLFEDESTLSVSSQLISCEMAEDEEYLFADTYYNREEKVFYNIPLCYSQTLGCISGSLSLGDMKDQSAELFGPSIRAALSDSQDTSVQQALKYISSFESKEAFEAFRDGKDRFDIKELLFKELIGNMSFDIIVHYNDGSDMTMTVKFVPGEIQREGFKASVDAIVSVVSDDDPGSKSE